MQKNRIRQAIQEEYEREKTDTNYNFLTRFAKAIYDDSVKSDSDDWITEVRAFIQKRLETSEMILEDIPMHMSKRADLKDDVQFCEALLDKMPLSGDRWISVGERLPEKYRDYITITDHGLIVVRRFDTNINVWLGNPFCNVTHWMELPKPPES